jgi:hypothetical protein
VLCEDLASSDMSTAKPAAVTYLHIV